MFIRSITTQEGVITFFSRDTANSLIVNESEERLIKDLEKAI